MPPSILAWPIEAAALVLLLAGLFAGDARDADASADAMLAVLPGI